VRILTGDCLTVLPTLPAGSVQTCVTSPPYWGLRDYGHEGQLGLERTPDEYVARMVAVFREVRRVLRDDGTLWLNLGDSYAAGSMSGRHGVNSSTSANRAHMGTALPARRPADGLKPKDLVGIPWRVAFALQADGWYLRSDVIWHKPNPMPESVTDRPTKAHEYLFLLSKSERYFYDRDAIAESAQRAGEIPGGGHKWSADGLTPSGGAQNLDKLGLRSVGDTRNRRTVWTIATQPFSGAHFAVMPPDLVEPCIKAGCPEGGTVLDPFAGAGTVGLVAHRLGRDFVGIELNPEYAAMARERIRSDAPLLVAFDDGEAA
jgi:DNA modification methylase